MHVFSHCCSCLLLSFGCIVRVESTRSRYGLDVKRFQGFAGMGAEEALEARKKDLDSNRLVGRRLAFSKKT